jgi:hypothetical protein
VAPTATDGQRWPLALRLAAVCTGSAALFGVVQLVGTLLQRRWYPYSHAGEWAAMLFVWMVHAACFAGLQLRRRWSRLLSATLAFGWAALLGMHAAEHLAQGASSDTTRVLVAVALMAVLALLGRYLASSSKVKLFLRH